MKSIIILFAITFSIFLGGCKKKSNNEPTSNSSSNTQNSVDTVSLSFNTEISLRDYYNLPQNNTFGSYSWVRYTTNSQLGVGDSIGVFGGSSHWQKFTGGGAISNTENDSTTANIKFNQHYNWSVIAAHIPNTQYLTTSPQPYMGINYFQNVNSISKSSGLTISHPIIYCSYIEYYVSDNSSLYITVDGNVNTGGSTTVHYVKKTVNGNSTGVTFTPSDLSSLSNSTTMGFVCARALNVELTHPTATVIYTYKNITRLTKSGFPITN